MRLIYCSASNIHSKVSILKCFSFGEHQLQDGMEPLDMSTVQQRRQSRLDRHDDPENMHHGVNEFPAGKRNRGPSGQSNRPNRRVSNGRYPSKERRESHGQNYGPN